MTNKEFAVRLRAIADVYEASEGVPQLYNVGECGSETVFCMDKGAAREALRAFGGGTKEDDGEWITYKPAKFPEILIRVYKNNVCNRLIVGTREVPATVIPARPATPEVTIPARVEEVYEWQCGSLLDEGDEK